MSKNKNKHNKKVEEVKQPEVIQQQPEVIQEQPQVQEEVLQETGNKQLPLTTLIAKYINGELPKNTYDVSRIRNENIGTTFEILVSRDESNISRSLPACYLLEANKQYTKTKYCDYSVGGLGNIPRSTDSIDRSTYVSAKSCPFEVDVGDKIQIVLKNPSAKVKIKPFGGITVSGTSYGSGNTLTLEYID